MKRFLRKYILGFLVFLIYRFLMWSWRITVVEDPSLTELRRQKKTFVLAHWHGDELALLHFAGKYDLATMASTSDDGEIMNFVIHMLGGATSRGSSTRGAVAGFKGLLRLTRQGHPVAFAVDGPKGPIYKVKPGVLEFSRLTKSPIFYTCIAVDRAWHFPRAWNKTFLPKPFCRLLIIWKKFSEPLPENFDSRSKELCEQLEAALRQGREIALKEFAAQT